MDDVIMRRGKNAPMEKRPPPVEVTRRRVFYIPGYDPIPPRRYRELYRKESKEQARISGYDIDIRARNTDRPFGWDVAAKIDEKMTLSRVEVLVWADIVKQSMTGDIFLTYIQMFRTAWIYISTGTLRRLMLLSQGANVAAFYPVVMMFAQLFASLMVMFAIMSIIARLIGFIPGDWYGFKDILIGWGGLALGGLAAIYLLKWFRDQDRKLYVYYLMHDFAFTAKNKGANPPQLEKRMREFEDQIAEALQSECEEVLIVGHSSGAHIAVSVVADLIREGRVPKDGPLLGFLSLGQVIPMISFLPRAKRLRRDLHELAKSDALTWIDISAPSDGCSFALADPVAVTGVEPREKRWPVVLSAAFSQTLSEEKMHKLRWRFFRLHFQYMCAFDQPKDYDYFQITGGPMTLRDRYYGRKSSRSRIDVVASKYQSMLMK